MTYEIQKEKIVILGSGPAGLSAAVYAARAGLNPLVIEGNKPGGQLMGTTYIENWPGITSTLGPSLMLDMRKHATHFGTRYIAQEIVQVDLQQRPFLLTAQNGKQIFCDALIIATGATPKLLGCPGEALYWARGVTTCAVCDGSFYKDKPVIIVGGGDSAMENALFMTNFTKDITIVHILSELTASKAMKDKVLTDNNIKIIYSSTVTNILGNDKTVEHVVISNTQTGETQTIPASAVFIAIGLTPNTHLFKDQITLSTYGYIILKEHTHTSVPGVFAAGDVADYRYRQAITSAGTGCAAALDAERYLKDLE